MKHDKFKRGSGCFPCGVCNRSTRDTGDNGDVGLCPECYEVAGLENTIADGAWETAGMTEVQVLARIEELNAIVVSKGGKL